MVFESNISRGKISEFVKVICCDFSSIISSDFTCWRISRTLRPFQNLTLRVKQDSAVFNTEQWIVLDCVGLSTIRNVNQLRSELRIVLTDYSKDRKHIVCRFYAFMSGLLLLWEGRSLVIQQKACQCVPKCFEPLWDDKMSLYSHSWQSEGEAVSAMWLQHFLSSISYLRDELAASFNCWVSQALPTWCLWGRYTLWLCELCVDQMGASCNLAIVQILLAWCWLWTIRSCQEFTLV